MNLNLPYSQHGVPRLSVITIFLNAEQYLDEAIQSVLAQTWREWEHVLVDDGSTDGSTQIAKRYCERFPDCIRYLEHASHGNLGMSASRNAGVAVARGEYVAFLDGDDVYMPERLERHAEVIAGHPGIAMVQSCLDYWSSWAGPLARQADEPELPPFGDFCGIVAPPALLLLLLKTHGATMQGTCSLTIRRDLYLQFGGCEILFRGLFEDQVLVSKLYLECPVFVMPDQLARYRMHPDSSVGRVGSAGLRAARRGYLEWLESYIQVRPEATPEVRQALRRTLIEYRHPRLWALHNAPAALLALLRRAAYALLPDAVAAPVGVWWRRRKRMNMERLLARAREKLP